MCLAFLLAAANPAHALRWSRIDNEAGLSHNTVFAILQDRQGFLWVGTVDGLDRYDGYEFVHYRHDPLDATTLSNQIVRSLVEDRAGSLWVGTDNGVSRLDRRTGRFTRYALSEGSGAAAKIVWCLYEDHGGALWAGTDQGLFRYDSGHDRFEPHALWPADGSAEPAAFVWAVGEDPSGRVWALTATSEGLRSALHPVEATGAPAAPYRFRNVGRGISTFLFDRAGRLWVRPPRPAVVDTPSRLITPPPGEDAPSTYATSIHEDRTGTLWFGGMGEGVLRLPPGARQPSPERLGREGGWFRNYVRTIFEDRAGAIWLGTYTGLHRHDPADKPFACLAHDRADANSLSSSVVSALWEDEAGTLWAGTFGAGLNRVDRARGTVVRYQARPGNRTRLRSDVVWALRGDGRGRLWVATEDGLCSLDPAAGRFTWRHLPYATPTFRKVLALARDADGTLWAGSPNGVHAIDTATGAARWYSLRQPQADAIESWVDSLLPDGSGGLWLGSAWQGIRLRHLDARAGAVTAHPLLGADGKVLPSEGVWMIHRDRQERLWAATGVGLSRFDPATGEVRHYFQRDGLPGAIVYAILEDRRGRLWLSTDRGLSVFDQRAPTGRAFRNFDRTDGICGNEFNRGAALLSRSGELLFGGVDGITVFDPEAVRDNPHVPPVAITGIDVWGGGEARAIPPFGLDRLELSWRDDSFAVAFAALSYGQAHKNRYAYRLEGFDEAWVEAGGRRFARYTSVPPGRYVFRVKGSSPDGVWNEEGASLAITIVPPFWQTLWFRALAAALLAALLYGAYRYRLSQLLKLERLRLRIASDLHDDLSSDLSAVAMATDMIRRRPGLEEPDRQRLAELRDKALEMTESLRDTVWYVQPEHDTMEAMVRRMKSAAAALLGDTPCEFEIALGDGVAIGMAVRRSVFLIYKELLHNVARHAGATHVSVGLRADNRRLRVRVADDGVGFDPAAGHAGEGLRSLKRRAAEIEASLEITSRPGAGSVSELSVDLSSPGRR